MRRMPQFRMASQMLTEQRDGTLILTLSDPATRNSLSPQASAAALEALARAEADPEVRCVVLRGDGDHFCGGGNLPGRPLRRRAKANSG